MAACPVRKTCAPWIVPGIVPAALRIASVRPFESAGSRFETICATTTSPFTAVTDTTRPVGSFSAARSAAARTWGTSSLAFPSPLATSVNEPVDRWPKWSWRITSARRVSVPGSVKRLVRRPES